ncbi:MAG: nucleotidyltransferase domain-containing protein [Roseburia sp.]|nr:nucleotidyltransferase domain-containing protein [Anaeroplasma bactoclasticum]MCM1196034.1 nucleotidyltransferase domain-containing protein [Roseburia sp.]MCM1557073.1 nucleotidyltransferase domain-containing protein [Anaeroplasma bactoclasticum]
MTIREIRIRKGLTQIQAANITGLSLRTYQNYEYEISTRDKFKSKQILKILTEYERITEDKGILSIDEIKEIVSFELKHTQIRYVYIFGSYAKGTPTEKSDIDLLISAEEKGLKFVGLVDELRKKLHKKLDIVRIDDLKNNFDFLNEILETGVRIYERNKK